MQALALIPHPSTPCQPIRRFEVRVRRPRLETLGLEYSIEGDISRLSLPESESRPSRRADGLWRHTCFEAFLSQPGRTGYREFNFAPSAEWAAYRFEAYRHGMSTPESAPPRIALRRGPQRLTLEAGLNLRGLVPNPDSELLLALAAVVETRDGAFSYWALAHPPGRPDFHHAAGFALTLDPPVLA